MHRVVFFLIVAALRPSARAAAPPPTLAGNSTEDNRTSAAAPSPTLAGNSTEDNRTTCRTTVARCRADYPELLSRIKEDLKPWNGGITPNATRRRLEESAGSNDAVAISVRHHRAYVRKWGHGYRGRADRAVVKVATPRRRLGWVRGRGRPAGHRLAPAQAHGRHSGLHHGRARRGLRRAGPVLVRLHDVGPREDGQTRQSGAARHQQGAARAVVPAHRQSQHRARV